MGIKLKKQKQSFVVTSPHYNPVVYVNLNIIRLTSSALTYTLFFTYERRRQQRRRRTTAATATNHPLHGDEQHWWKAGDPLRQRLLCKCRRCYRSLHYLRGSGVHCYAERFYQRTQSRHSIVHYV